MCGRHSGARRVPWSIPLRQGVGARLNGDLLPGHSAVGCGPLRPVAGRVGGGPADEGVQEVHGERGLVLAEQAHVRCPMPPVRAGVVAGFDHVAVGRSPMRRVDEIDRPVAVAGSSWQRMDSPRLAIVRASVDRTPTWTERTQVRDGDVLAAYYRDAETLTFGRVRRSRKWRRRNSVPTRSAVRADIEIGATTRAETRREALCG